MAHDTNRYLTSTISDQRAPEMDWNPTPVLALTPNTSQQMFATPSWEIPPNEPSTLVGTTPTAISRRQGPSPFSNQTVPSTQDWENRRGRITQLYRDEKRSLKDVKAIMESQYGFKATDMMYKKRITKWNIGRNLNSSERATICRIIKQRESMGKMRHQIVVREQTLDAHRFSHQTRKMADGGLLVQQRRDKSDRYDEILIFSPTASPRMVQATISYPSSSKTRRNLTYTFADAYGIPCVIYPPGDRKNIEIICSQVTYFFKVASRSEGRGNHIPLSSLCEKAQYFADKSLFREARITLDRTMEILRCDVTRVSPHLLVEVIGVLALQTNNTVQCFDAAHIFNKLALDLCSVLLGPEHPVTSVLRLSKDISSRIDVGHWSLRAAAKATMARKVVEGDLDVTLALVRGFADELVATQQYQQAEEVIEHVFTLYHNFKMQGSIDLQLLDMLGNLKLSTGDYEEADAAFSNILEKGMGLAYNEYMGCNGLALIAFDMGNLDKAEEYFRRVLEGAIDCFGIEDDQVFWPAYQLAHVLQEGGKLEQAQEIRAKYAPTDPLDVTDIEGEEGIAQ